MKKLEKPERKRGPYFSSLAKITRSFFSGGRAAALNRANPGMDLRQGTPVFQCFSCPAKTGSRPRPLPLSGDGHGRRAWIKTTGVICQVSLWLLISASSKSIRYKLCKRNSFLLACSCRTLLSGDSPRIHQQGQEQSCDIHFLEKSFWACLPG